MGNNYSIHSLPTLLRFDVGARRGGRGGDRGDLKGEVEYITVYFDERRGGRGRKGMKWSEKVRDGLADYVRLFCLRTWLHHSGKQQ